MTLPLVALRRVWWCGHRVQCRTVSGPREKRKEWAQEEAGAEGADEQKHAPDRLFTRALHAGDGVAHLHSYVRYVTVRRWAIARVQP